MFNRYESHSYRGGDIFVKQQPNDAADAARLYGELKDKGEKQIESIILHQFSGINFQIPEVQWYKDLYHLADKAHFLAKINGKEVKFNLEFQERLTPEKIQEEMIRQIAVALTREVFYKSAEVIFRRQQTGVFANGI